VVKKQQITIESRTDRLIEVRDFVSTAAREFGFTDEEVSKIALAVDEACTNIIKHAYHFDPRKDIVVRVSGSDGAFVIAIRDRGDVFNPGAIETPDLKEYMTHYRRGGLGVYLMRSLMDKVEYDIHPGMMNEVRLTKFLAR
jgi:serine/threonine-protein kinase RsbW